MQEREHKKRIGRKSAYNIIIDSKEWRRRKRKYQIRWEKAKKNGIVNYIFLLLFFAIGMVDCKMCPEYANTQTQTYTPNEK